MAFLPFAGTALFGPPLILIIWKVTRLARRGKHFFARARSLKWDRFIAYLGMIFPENRFPLFGIMP
jgi:hypothetical protein